ncbi:MAG TPA: class I SAM-dependent methyltransferase [Vitreimonas sp.]|jgi:predicted O-methyltransferase YrrM|nr:class I SAM-dependent methyltransferase [Vitreimonas sp.]
MLTQWLKSNPALNSGLQAAHLWARPKRDIDAHNVRAISRFDVMALLSDPAASEAYKVAAVRFATLGLEHIKDAANAGDLRALFQLVHALRPRAVLEIGTCNAASTAFIALAMRELGADSQCITSVDIVDVNDPEKGLWKRSGMPYPPGEMLERLSVDDLVRLESGGSESFFRTSMERFDFIFIDGSHRASDVYADVAGALARLNANGVIALHDFYPDARPLWPDEPVIPGVYLGVVRAIEECPDLGVVPLRQLPWRTKHGGHTTSLAVLTGRRYRHWPSNGF